MRFIVLIFILGLSCSTKKSDNDNEQIEKQIKNFLTWYSQNWDTLNVDLMNPIVDNMWLDPPDSTRPYRVNFEKAEIYLSQFSKAGYMSDTYLDNFRQYFRTCQADFEKSNQYYGPAEGFEFEFVFRSQMYDYESKNPDKAIVTDIMVDNSKATATVKFYETYFYIYKLTKTNGIWQIDQIKGSWED
jgi:hypothetical protein